MWAGVVQAVATLLNSIISFFKKTEAEKERDRIANEIDADQRKSKEIGDAMKRGKKGDTSKIEDIINDNLDR